MAGEKVTRSVLRGAPSESRRGRSWSDAFRSGGGARYTEASARGRHGASLTRWLARSERAMAETPAAVRWTIADLELFPEDNQRYEIVDGELFVSRAAGNRHQRVCVE